MADHATQQIINTLKSVLMGATDAGVRVFVERLDPLAPSELPALLIEPGTEEVEDITVAVPYKQRRLLMVKVTCVVAESTGYGAAVRQLGKQVEQVLSASESIHSLTKDVARFMGSMPQNSGDSAIAHASLAQHWRFRYITRNDHPEIFV